MPRGSLTIVGTGISIGQITVEARDCIEKSRCLLALVADPVALAWLTEINPATQSLMGFYAKSKPRRVTYQQMVRHTMSLLRRGKDVCLVVFGHPGVLTFPTHELMRRTAAERIPSRMLPGVSAEDCLFADLGVDPGECGCQSFEATDFLLRQRRFDPTSALILWQFGAIGEQNYPTGRKTKGIKILAERLAEVYGLNHKVIIYKAAIYPICNPVRLKVTLSSLPRADYSPMCTMFVPPLRNRPIDRAISRALAIKIR